MRRLSFLLAACLCLVVPGAGQNQNDGKDANQNQPPPRSDRSQEAGESSSRDTLIDLTPPRNDAKDHPNSTLPLDDADDAAPGDVQEFHTFDPHRAAKDIEVGDFYFKRKNYRAALERYREALLYKPNDAFANFPHGAGPGEAGRLDEAAECYQEYLKILPTGPQAGRSQEGAGKNEGQSARRKKPGQTITFNSLSS